MCPSVILQVKLLLCEKKWLLGFAISVLTVRKIPLPEKQIN